MLIVFAPVQDIVRFLQTQVAPLAVVPGPSVDYAPLECVGGALVLQPPYVAGQPRAVSVPLVPEVSEVVGVPGAIVPRPADVELDLVVPVLVLRGDLALVDAVGSAARPRHGTVPRAAGARRLRLRRGAVRAQQAVVVHLYHRLLVGHAAVGQLQVVTAQPFVQRIRRRE